MPLVATWMDLNIIISVVTQDRERQGSYDYHLYVESKN